MRRVREREEGKGEEEVRSGRGGGTESNGAKGAKS